MIGVFDSGLGGLSVLAAIERALPECALVYFADTAHMPYGNKSDAFILARVLRIGHFLAEQGCTTLVVACNTATAAAVGELRSSLPYMHIVAIEPGVKPAAQASRNRHIAILTTASTARSARLSQLIATYAAHIKVDIIPCPEWATRVEALHLDAADFHAEIRNTIAPLLLAGCDQIVLGCTHYSFLKPIMLPLCAQRANLVDVADAVARQVARLHDAQAGNSSVRLFASAAPERLHAALPLLGLDRIYARATTVQLSPI